MAGGELPDLTLLTEEEQAAVVKMQASARGYLAGPHTRRPRPPRHPTHVEPSF